MMRASFEAGPETEAHHWNWLLDLHMSSQVSNQLGPLAAYIIRHHLRKSTINLPLTYRRRMINGHADSKMPIILLLSSNLH